MSEDEDPDFPKGVRPGDTIAEKYVVETELGVGGMGFVVRARDKLLQRRVAIKFLLPTVVNAPHAVQRFMREARLASAITSEHAVKILEVDTLKNGEPFLAMEYLEGRDLKRLLEEGPVPLARAVDHLLQAMEAIAEGHARGIVHRDIKPSNLFLTQRADATPLVKVLDFGIAKTIEQESGQDTTLTDPEGSRLGSPAYMSPEQLQVPEAVDSRTDIWSLGVTLYELVCGSQPFRGASYAELVIGITSSSIERPRQRRPDLGLSRAFEHVLMRCLERDQTRRYPHLLELATALAPHGGDDARASLRRIRGIATSFSGAPARPTATAGLKGTTDTLPSPVARVRGTIQPVETSTRGTTGPPPRATILVLAGLGVLGGALAFREGNCGHARVPEGVQSVVATEASSATQAAREATPAAAASKPYLPARSDSAALEPHRPLPPGSARASGARTTIVPPRPPPGRDATAEPAPSAGPGPRLTVASVSPQTEMVAVATSASPPPTVPASSVSPLPDGRLPQIENLIQRRH